MPSFESYDGTMIAYRVAGEGPPLVCLPGGPGRANTYFGDLGGLSRHRTLIMPDTRGCGESADAADPASYRCDRMVADVEALRAHLGLASMDLLGHSAAGSLATLYAASHPDRITHLILLTPALDALGIEETEQEWRAALAARSAEPWYADALAAIDKAEAGDESLEVRARYVPFFYGRWDEAARVHSAIGVSPRSAPIRAHYQDAGAFDPGATRAAAKRVTAPVLVYAGELDAGPTPRAAAEAAACFPSGAVAVQPGAGHFPWLDDPAYFTGAIAEFLG
jgi:pimeloyl-ACP methyl ester carboxylesterase